MVMAKDRKPGRPKNEPLMQVVPDGLDKTPHDMIEVEEHANSLQLAHERNLTIIDQTYGENLPYDRTRIENEVRFFIHTQKVAMIETGRRLVLLKEHEERGKFLESLERIDINPRTAQAMMKAFLKFGSGRATSLQRLGTAKMFELLGESDEDLAGLADGGTLAGYNADDMENMSKLELRAALNKEKERRAEEEEANQMLLQKKDEKINELDRELMERTKRVKQWSGVVSEINTNTQIFAGAVIENYCHLSTQIDEIIKESEKSAVSEAELGQLVEPLNAQLIAISEHLDGLVAKFQNHLLVKVPVHEPLYAPLLDDDIQE